MLVLTWGWRCGCYIINQNTTIDGGKMEIKVKRLDLEAKIPTKAHPSDSGWDLYALKTLSLAPSQTIVIPTGLAFGIPVGHEVQIRPRSGVSSKTPLRVILGTVDQSYRGEVGIIVQNTSNQIETIPAGYKLAQAVLTILPNSSMVEVSDLDDTSRGNSGFGSSGV